LTAAEVNRVFHELIGATALGVEAAGVAVIVASIVRMAVTRGTIRYLFRLDAPDAYRSYKEQFGKGLLMGMDLLVAGDLIKSVALDLTTSAITALAILVLIRTLLSWSIQVEIDGCWPWKRAKQRSTGRDSR